jgi:hypothetical protein
MKFFFKSSVQSYKHEPACYVNNTHRNSGIADRKEVCPQYVAGLSGNGLVGDQSRCRFS